MKKGTIIETLVFMSWENEYNDLRAIALCDKYGYFDVAINCMRHSDMGEMDENGVYERQWLSDYIDCYGDEHETLRLANKKEVELYLQYITAERAIGADKPPFCKNQKYDIDIIEKGFGDEFSYFVVQYTPKCWVRRLFAEMRLKWREARENRQKKQYLAKLKQNA